MKFIKLLSILGLFSGLVFGYSTQDDDNDYNSNSDFQFQADDNLIIDNELFDTNTLFDDDDDDKFTRSKLLELNGIAGDGDIGTGGVVIYPVVLLHGILSDKTELSTVANWLMENVPNKVFNIDIGNGKKDSMFKTMLWQLNELCYTIYNIPELQNGFHFIGISQGGLLARAYVEKCNKYPVKNLITWVSPHGGVYGFNDVYFDFIKVYNAFYQNHHSIAGYWKDPYQYENYLSYASFLPYLNNEVNASLIEINNKKFDGNLRDNNVINWIPEQNKANMVSLKNFVMIWSPNDDVLSPPESGKFSFYKIISNSKVSLQPGNILPIEDLFDTTQFQNDVLGLKILFETSRLHIFETNCTHRGHKTEECFPQLEQLTLPFLII